MKSLVTWLGDTLLGKKGKGTETRLSEAEAVEIASAYAKVGSLGWPGMTLAPHEVRDVGGKLVWTLRTPTAGRWLTVDVDDATGEVVGHQVHGVR
jgi:hypothetical protein